MPDGNKQSKGISSSCGSNDARNIQGLGPT